MYRNKNCCRTSAIYKIRKLHTYITHLFPINCCKDIISQKQSKFFWPTVYVCPTADWHDTISRNAARLESNNLCPSHKCFPPFHFPQYSRSVYPPQHIPTVWGGDSWLWHYWMGWQVTNRAVQPLQKLLLIAPNMFWGMIPTLINSDKDGR